MLSSVSSITGEVMKYCIMYSIDCYLVTDVHLVYFFNTEHFQDLLEVSNFLIICCHVISLFYGH